MYPNLVNKNFDSILNFKLIESTRLNLKKILIKWTKKEKLHILIQSKLPKWIVD